MPSSQGISKHGWIYGTSKEAKVLSGVLQGSVSDPLLFLIHMRDIDKRMRGSSISSFADDIGVSLSITAIEDVPHFQQDLECNKQHAV